MRRASARRRWRITEPVGKVGYVVAATIIGWLLLAMLLLGVRLPETAVSVVGAVWFVAWIVTGFRVFRGPGEQVDPPRAWWRATARPGVGFVLAGLFVVGLVPAGRVPGDVPGTVAQLLVAAWYLASSIVLASRASRSR